MVLIILGDFCNTYDDLEINNHRHYPTRRRDCLFKYYLHFHIITSNREHAVVPLGFSVT